MLAVQPRRRRQSYEKLAAVRVRARVRHRNRVRPVVPQMRPDLVLELPTPDALAARPISGRIARLYHETLDHAVKHVPVVIAVLAVHAEVLDGFRAVFREQFQVHVAEDRVNDGVFVQALRDRVVGGRENVLFRRLFVEDVAVLVVRLRVVRLAPAEEEKAGFFVRGAY